MAALPTAGKESGMVSNDLFLTLQVLTRNRYKVVWCKERAKGLRVAMIDGLNKAGNDLRTGCSSGFSLCAEGPAMASAKIGKSGLRGSLLLRPQVSSPQRGA